MLYLLKYLRAHPRARTVALYNKHLLAISRVKELVDYCKYFVLSLICTSCILLFSACCSCHGCYVVSGDGEQIKKKKFNL